MALVTFSITFEAVRVDKIQRMFAFASTPASFGCFLPPLARGIGTKEFFGIGTKEFFWIGTKEFFADRYKGIFWASVQRNFLGIGTKEFLAKIPLYRPGCWRKKPWFFLHVRGSVQKNFLQFWAFAPRGKLLRPCFWGALVPVEESAAAARQ